MGGGVALWIRWSWRDLRRRWLLVAAIALVIALGSGTYASLLSTSAWRTRSNDASFALLHTHDIRVALPQGQHHRRRAPRGSGRRPPRRGRHQRGP
jgi:putative ABC transport system permease protein